MSHKDNYLDQDGLDNADRFRTQYMDERGRIDLEALQAGADKAAEEREKARLEYWENERQKFAKEQEALGDLMQKLSDSIKADNKAAADAKIKEETERAAKEIREKYNKEHNVKDETPTDKAWANLLKGMKNI